MKAKKKIGHNDAFLKVGKNKHVECKPVDWNQFIAIPKSTISNSINDAIHALNGVHIMAIEENKDQDLIHKIGEVLKLSIELRALAGVNENDKENK